MTRKNIYAACGLTAMALTTQAQVTITGADLPSVNDTFRLSTTTDLWSIDPTLTGTNYNWDFSFLVPAAQNADTCLDVSTMPPSYQFYFNNGFTNPAHKANFAIKGAGVSFGGMFELDNVIEFYKITGSAYQSVGLGANVNGIDVPGQKNPIEQVHPLPLVYGDAFTNFSKLVVTIPGTLEYKQKKFRSGSVDGWGNVTTPYGTFPALRVVYTINIIDSIFLDTIFPITYEAPRPTELQYCWIAPGQDVPVLQVNVDDASGDITQIIYKDIYRAIVGLNEAPQNVQVSLYPNPAHDAVTITSAASIKTVTLYDQAGRQVYTSGLPVNNTWCTIPLGLADGVYIAEVNTAAGMIRQKLVVR